MWCKKVCILIFCLKSIHWKWQRDLVPIEMLLNLTLEEDI